MHDMPLRNPALEIDVVGFRFWEGRHVGVLITPWTVSLAILPAPALVLGERQRWTFPSGEYEFMGGEEPECGPFQFCSLFSPPDKIADQAQARAIAEAGMEQLFGEPAGGAAPRPTGVSRRSLFGLRSAE
jgi:[NiFe] hydrogenase assembly HybE family chaperone